MQKTRTMNYSRSLNIFVRTAIIILIFILFYCLTECQVVAAVGGEWMPPHFNG